MPELPDVEGFRRVAESAAGRQLTGVRVHDADVLRDVSPRTFSRMLVGRYVERPDRHGKWLLLPTNGDARAKSGGERPPVIMMHFGMTGLLLWTEPDEPDHDHDRVVLGFSEGELRYRDMRKLQGIRLARHDGDVDAVLADLGPDAATVSLPDLRKGLGQTRRRLKSALMDQSRIAGLGNLTVDEILWRARLAPRLGTTDLGQDDWRSLHQAIRRVLHQSSRAGYVPDRRSWLTGRRQGTDPHCPRCSARLRTERITGRTTYWCPHCQPDRSGG